MTFTRRAPAPGCFYTPRLRHGGHARSELAYSVMCTLRDAIRHESERGALASALLLGETETLEDRIDLVIAEGACGLVSPAEQQRRALDTLLSAKVLLNLALATGEISDTLWLANNVPCTLFDYVEMTVEQLRGLAAAQAEVAP